MRDENNISSLLALEPDYIGLIFYPLSSRYVNGVLNLEIPEYCKLTGVFVDEDIEIIIQKIEEQNLKAVQLHGNESAEFCGLLKNNKPDLEIIKAFGVDQNFDFEILKNYLPEVDYFLFDTKTPQYGGSGTTFDWSVLEKYPYQKSYFLSGGISDENFEKVVQIEDPRLHAIDLNSKFESAPGFKDIEKIKLTIEKYLPNREN